MHPDRYAHRVQESCANLRRIVDLECIENNAWHDKIYEDYGQNPAVGGFQKSRFNDYIAHQEDNKQLGYLLH